MGKIVDTVLDTLEEENKETLRNTKAKLEKMNQGFMATHLNEEPGSTPKVGKGKPTKKEAAAKANKPPILKLVRDPAVEGIKYGTYPTEITTMNIPAGRKVARRYKVTAERLLGGLGYEVKLWDENNVNTLA